MRYDVEVYAILEPPLPMSKLQSQAQVSFGIGAQLSGLLSVKAALNGAAAYGAKPSTLYMWYFHKCFVEPHFLQLEIFL